MCLHDIASKVILEEIYNVFFCFEGSYDETIKMINILKFNNNILKKKIYFLNNSSIHNHIS